MKPYFVAPSPLERAFNRLFGALVGLGFGLRHTDLLQVRRRAYLTRFARTVQRYFPVPAGAPPDAFAAIAERYSVFELLPID